MAQRTAENIFFYPAWKKDSSFAFSAH